jgi:ABC-2 type transport system ATP-binding protein
MKFVNITLEGDKKMNTQIVAELKNVSKKYGHHEVLKNVSITISKGEVIGIIGPNGAGKSTLMKILVGLVKNYEGKVEMPLNQKGKKNIGCVIETPGFYGNCTGYDNLKYFAALSGCKTEKEIDEVIKLLEIEDFIYKKASKYSLGMKQRLGLAQAILGEPVLLVLDEPTNGLDPNVIPEIRKFIQYISKEKGVAVLISSHILSEIETICDRVIGINKGEIIDNTTNEDIHDKHENLEQHFLNKMGGNKNVSKF